MSRAIPPLPNTPSWRGAQLKHRDNFTFTFYTINKSGNVMSAGWKASDTQNNSLTIDLSEDEDMDG
jgi:hypothetical protein